MAEQLGQAELELTTDQGRLIAGLAEAEARVAKSVSVMQAMLDHLHADITTRIGTMDALAAKAAQVGTGPGSATPAPGHTTTVGGGSNIWGIRGPERPGSMTNPIVTVLEAAKYTPMGSYAAAVGESNASDAQRGQTQSGFASAADMAALTSAVQDLANNANPVSQMATAASSGLAEPNSGERTVVALDSEDRMALREMAAALSRMEDRGDRPSGSGDRIIVEHDTKTVQGQGRTIVVPSGGGGGHTIMSGPAGANVVRLDGGQYAGLISAIMDSHKQGLAQEIRTSRDVVVPSSGGGGSSSSSNHDLLSNILFGHSGGGGGGGPRLNLGIGSVGIPHIGAGFGSLGSFAGLGAEHFALTAGAVAGSAVNAGIGAGLLGLGSLGTAAIGGGSDMLVSHEALSGVTTLRSDLQALNQTQAEFGKSSKEGVAAQKLFNYQVAQFGPAAQPMLAFGQQVQTLDNLFKKLTLPAQMQALGVFKQVLQAGTDFTPLVAAAALRNLTIINDSIKPLFSWLEGPHGIGIFQSLENIFAKNLPTGIAALTQFSEFFLRVVDLAAQHTGGLTKSLDNLFTKLNNLSDARLGASIDKYIHDFDLWKKLVEVLGEDLHNIFSQDAGTGNAIVKDLTQMLEKLKEWTTSTSGKDQLHNLFEIHKKEIIELLNLLPELLSGFGTFYLTVAPGLTTAFTDIVKPLNAMVQGFEKISGGAFLVGLAIVAAKLNLLRPGLEALAKAGGLIGQGSLLSHLPGSIGEKFAGLGGGSNIVGVRGGVAPGSSLNPLAVVQMGSQGVPGALATDAEEAGGAGAGFFADATGVSSINPIVAAVIASAAFAKFIYNPLVDNPKPAAQHSVAKLQQNVPSGLSPAQVQNLLAEAGGAKLSGEGRVGELPGQADTLKLLQQTDAALKQFASTGNAAGLQTLIDKAKSLEKEWPNNKAQLQSLITVMREAEDDVLPGVGSQLAKLGPAFGPMRRAIAAVEPAFKQMEEAAGKSLSTILQTSNQTGAKIAQTLGTHSTAAREAMAQNWELAVKDIQISMQAGVISSSAGMAEIDKLLAKALRALGAPVKTSDIVAIGPAEALGLVKFQQTGAAGSGSPGGHFAQGGVLGSWGERGPDDVPIMAARGEAILNAPQQALANAYLSPIGGLPGLFAATAGTKHMAGGGFVADPGTQQTEGQLPQLTARLNALGRALGVIIYGISGYRSPAHSVAVGGFADDPHTRGEAEDIGVNSQLRSSAAQISEAELAKFGLYRPFDPSDDPNNTEVNHIQLLASAGALPAAMAAGMVDATGPTPKLKAPSVKGSGAVADMVRATLKKVTAAANSTISAKAAALAPAGGGGGSVAVPTIAQGSVEKEMFEAGRKLGLSKIAIAGFIGNATQESSLNPNLNVVGGPDGDGKGLFSWNMAGNPFWTSKVVLGNVAQQMALAVQEMGPGAIGHLNTLGDPASAAQYVETVLENAGIPDMANRIAAAQQAYGAGYSGGGFVVPKGTKGLNKPSDATALYKAGYYPGYDPATKLHEWHTKSQWSAIYSKYDKGRDGKKVPKKAPKPPAPPPKLRLGKPLGGFSTSQGDGMDMMAIQHTLGVAGGFLTGTGHGDIPYLSGKYDYLSGVNSTDFGSANLVVTQDNLGNSIAPYIDWPTVDADVKQLQELYGIQSQMKQDYQNALKIIAPVVKAIKRAIVMRKALIAKAKKQIHTNTILLNSLKKQLKSKGITHSQTKTLDGQIHMLESSNKSLGGNASGLGTGGQIGAWSNQIGTLNNEMSTATGYLPGGGAALQGLFKEDPGFPIGQANQSLSDLYTQIGNLSPTALGQTLAIDKAQFTPATTADDSTLISLLQQQVQTADQSLYVSQQQYGVLAGLPSFAQGGVVPGPPGAAQLVIAHGGEEFLGVGQSSGNVSVHFADGMSWLKDFMHVEINGHKQEIADSVGRIHGKGARARRQLPSRTSLLT